MLRREGLRIRSGGAPAFAKRLAELTLPTHLEDAIAPLLVQMASLNEQLKAADKELVQLTKNDDVVKRLCTVPSVGPVTAVSFLAFVDKVERIARMNGLFAPRQR